MKLEKLHEPGEFEEVYLSENDYDASRSSIEIHCHTHNENNEECWKSYRDFSLHRVSAGGLSRMERKLFALFELLINLCIHRPLLINFQ